VSIDKWPHGGLRCRCGHQGGDRQDLSDHIALARRDAAWNPQARVPHGDALPVQLWRITAWTFAADAVCAGLSAAGIPPGPQVGMLLFVLLFLGLPALAVWHLVRLAQEHFGYARHRRAATLAAFDAAPLDPEGP